VVPRVPQGGDGARGADRHRARRDREHARTEREVAQMLGALSDGPVNASDA
jgi:hypothetical protein